MLELTESARVTAGLVALAIVTIEAGGVLLLRMATGGVPATKLQGQFFRAGHAHAGVLVTLGLVCLLLTQATQLSGAARWLAQTGVLVAAILMPAGFFLAAAGRGRDRPGRAIVLVPAGAVVLAAGVVTLGVGLLSA
jgi:uncharacterized membrane protein SirB2